VEPGVEETERARLVAAAVQRWTKDLIDTGKRNPLLWFKDLSVGTLAFGPDMPPAAMTGLLTGRPVAMSSLFVTETARNDARKRLRAIRKKIVELQEERGIDTGYLAMGLATWWEPETPGPSRPPAAPVLLRQVTIRARSAAEDDFDLELADDTEVNPVLVHYLAETLGTRINPDELLDVLDTETVHDPTSVFDRLTKLCTGVPGFAIEDRTVLGTFSYQKLPMVKDLKTGVELLVESDVVAALAGDAEAQTQLRGNGGAGDALKVTEPDRIPPQDEFLVKDADSSQSYAINAAVAGGHVVIKGPPGTGKSQTITNLVATLIARGQKVLFVAEKRAAIDAVLSRLQHAELGTWVMDLHDGLSNRRKVAQGLAATLDRASRTAPTNLTALHRELTTNRDRLLAHNDAMHKSRAPWGLSVFDVQSRLLALDDAGVTFRLRGSELRGASEAVIARAKHAISEYADLGGFTAAEASPWTGAPIHSPDQAQAAFETVNRLREQTVPAVSATLTQMIHETGLPAPTTVAMWQSAFALIDRAAASGQVLRPDVFDEDLPALIAATATGKWRKTQQVTMGWGQRRKLKKHAATLTVAGKASRKDLHVWLTEAATLNQEWRCICVDGLAPRLPGDLGGAHGAYEQLSTELRALAAHMHSSVQLDALDPKDALPQRLDSLIADRGTLYKLPQRHALEAELSGYGLGALLAECRQRGISADQAAEMLEAVWLHSVLDEVALTDAAYGSFQGATLNRSVEAFQRYDNVHIDTTGARVQRACAERLYASLDAHPEQAVLIQKQARLKTRHMAMRDLLAQAPEVLLDLKPCWAMSPLVVSQVLPMRQMFDVVIFDEASQVPPADAVPSIARGKRVVVAGDEHQLPPTTFFATATADEDAEAEDREHLTLTSGFESILDALAPVVPLRSLEWHYRSQDERLIAFSNAHIYDSSLTTFPGAHTDGVLQHVHVPCVPGAAGSEDSATAEVDKVVDLVIAHAETRPHESLGVIAMGIKHADRIDAAVRAKLANRRDLDDFFTEARDERFFVKNLERVQGDERDAIILSVGYGKSADGRMLYRFGPLNTEGGERRLNVAVSRSKKRMTLVSSFTSADLDPAKLRARGAELLGAYVAFMESCGADLGSFTPVPAALNPFEQDVRDRLTRAGIPLTAQYGVSGYRIDFAATHPKQPARFVLAIEADGASYHSSTTARDRDRLRQEHLERLGWRFHRIWSTDWFRDPDTEVAKAVTAYETAVRAVDDGHPGGGRVAPPVTEIPPNVVAPVEPQRSAPRPSGIGYRAAITDYSHAELVALIRWIQSDGLLRTEDDLISESMSELGFARRGGRIVAALQAAIADARRTR